MGFRAKQREMSQLMFVCTHFPIDIVSIYVRVGGKLQVSRPHDKIVYNVIVFDNIPVQNIQ